MRRVETDDTDPDHVIAGACQDRKGNVMQSQGRTGCSGLSEELSAGFLHSIKIITDDYVL